MKVSCASSQPRSQTLLLLLFASSPVRPTLNPAKALADASSKVSGLHPGLVILDEPLQQNPDPKHRELFLSFLSKELAKKLPFQVVIFTSLRQAEIAQLRRGGVSVATPEGSKFLKLEPPQPPPQTTAKVVSELEAPFLIREDHVGV